jgi:hypothetical protein
MEYPIRACTSEGIGCPRGSVFLTEHEILIDVRHAEPNTLFILLSLVRLENREQAIPER